MADCLYSSGMRMEVSTFVFSFPSSGVSQPFPNLTVTVIAEGAMGERRSLRVPQAGRGPGIWEDDERGPPSGSPAVHCPDGQVQRGGRALPADGILGKEESGGLPQPIRAINESRKCSPHEFPITMDVASLFPAQR